MKQPHCVSTFKVNTKTRVIILIDARRQMRAEYKPKSEISLHQLNDAHG